jgi:hypothetical protein
MQAKFTIMKEVTDENRDEVVSLVEALFSGLLDGKVTYVQGTLTVVTDEARAHTLEQAGEALGITVTTKPM